MRRGSAPARAQSGLAYLGVLMLAAAIAAGLAATARPWSMQQQRAREAELLFIGQQFQRAIASYYRAGPSPAFPRSLDALLRTAACRSCCGICAACTGIRSRAAPIGAW